MDALSSAPVIAALAIALAVLLLVSLYLRNYIKVPPNQVAVFSGRGTPKIVRGGGRFKLPGIERVDMMNIEPFKVDVDIKGAVSKEGVPVSVGAVALVRFGSAEEIITTAVERFLTSDTVTMEDQAREIVSGNLRGIIANLTVEELNQNREELSRRVVDEAESSFGRIGMELEVLTIQTISDEKGYLEALGRRRVAEVVRDAEIGEAEARRDATIRSAEARRLGETAAAEAEAAIAQANRDRDLRVAGYTGEVAAQQATANQAGPLADAQAQKAVAIAEEETNAAREQAAIQVEKQRVLRTEQAQESEVVVPASARRKAAELNAEAEKITLVKDAEGEAEKVRLMAEAARSRMIAEAEGRKAGMLAEAEGTKAGMLAEAEGQQAGLEAEAAGRKELAAALNSYSEAAMRLQVLPDMIKTLPEVAKEIAGGVSAIDRYIVIDTSGAGDGETSSWERLLATIPAGVFATVEAFKAATGVDVGALLEQAPENGDRAQKPKGAAKPEGEHPAS